MLAKMGFGKEKTKVNCKSITQGVLVQLCPYIFAIGVCTHTVSLFNKGYYWHLGDIHLVLLSNKVVSQIQLNCCLVYLVYTLLLLCHCVPRSQHLLQ